MKIKLDLNKVILLILSIVCFLLMTTGSCSLIRYYARNLTEARIRLVAIARSFGFTCGLHDKVPLSKLWHSAWKPQNRV